MPFDRSAGTRVCSARDPRRQVAGLAWQHGKSSKAVARIEALDAELLRRPDYEFSTLWWNFRRVSCYLRSHASYLVNYGRRHHKGLPISSGIAESAVNQVVSMRMAKKKEAADAVVRRGCTPSSAGSRA